MTVIDSDIAFIVITDDTTPDQLHETLRHLTDDAERTSRRGKAFTRGNPEYAIQHARINAILSELEARA